MTLGDTEIAGALAGLSGWAREGTAIQRTYRFDDFKSAIVFVNAVAALAERENHHPDLTIRYKDVTVSYWTHSAGGVTARDVDLARKVDTLLPDPRS
ncbi:MAG: 4a-hydroxytetrahydrobiopterin dehydratase [Candidatus Rokubacteria bacterium]|nr:4a-hydroxytetrahydrobiopterin dehydratase [Candidatus Rokubacteria bacterium]MBI3825816.1 4a-hydroxytetrahydrobiopterin dehydratase [Candidatus Rokubacteria bacterium]